MSFKGASPETLAKLGYPSEKLYETSFSAVEAITKGHPEIAFKFITDQGLNPKEVIAFLEKALSSGVVPTKSVAPIKNTIAVLKKNYNIAEGIHWLQDLDPDAAGSVSRDQGQGRCARKSLNLEGHG